MSEYRTAYGKASWSDDLPSSDLEVCEENLDLFFKTMFERQEIWYKRFILKEKQPWTEDEFFANNKFTNVYRELDKNSQWMIKNIHLVETNRRELIWKILLFRIFNNPETFEYIKTQKRSFKGALPNYDEYDKEEWKKLITSYRNTGANPFTNAYLINSQACPGCTRDECYLNKVVPTIHSSINKIDAFLKGAKKPEHIIEALKKLPAVADFIAHEFYQDFTYAPRYSKIRLMEFDQNDYTNVGPGAKIGIRLIFPNRETGAEQKQAIYDLRDLAQEYLASIGKFKFIKGYDNYEGKYITSLAGDITLHAVEMWLCEFQKYWKMKIGKGKQRSKFKPSSTGLLK